jgi:predicted HicB family RNase H-like nuclease
METIKVTAFDKECKECNKRLPIENYTKCFKTSDGYNTLCKMCYKHKRKILKERPPNITILRTDKQCNNCNVIKNVSFFRKTSKSLDGLFHKCNDCWKPIEWNKEKQKQSERKYIENNREKIREKYKRQGKKINRRIRSSLNHRISELLKAGMSNKRKKTLTYVGCNFEYLKHWFEFLFDEKMTWDNYGEWEIDHVMPCSHFDLSSMEDQLICFNWKNLRPCWKINNIIKGNRIIDSIIETHKKNLEDYMSINPLPTYHGNIDKGAK